MKIAIYNGNLHPTTFVLRLVEAIHTDHDVCICGTSSKVFKFKKKGICFLPTDPRHNILLFIECLFSLVLFSLFYPNKSLSLLAILRSSKKPVKTRIKQFLIWSKLLTKKIDLVHIQWASHIYLFEEILDLNYFKMIVSLRGSLIKIAPIVNAKTEVLYRETFPKVDHFHAVSQDIKKEAIVYGAPENKIKVIYSGVELSYFDNFKKQPGRIGNNLKILSVGRPHWNKGYKYALEAFKIIKTEGIKASYTIIGASNSEELIYMVHDLDLSNDVTLRKNTTYNNVLQAMQEADVLVLPSVSEGLANVVIEAMAIKLPVISSDVGGMKELVNHGNTGLLFKNRDVDDLAKNLMLFDSLSSEQGNNMVANAYLKVNEQHSWQTFTNDFKELYLNSFKQDLLKI